MNIFHSIKFINNAGQSFRKAFYITISIILTLTIAVITISACWIANRNVLIKKIIQKDESISLLNEDINYLETSNLKICSKFDQLNQKYGNIEKKYIKLLKQYTELKKIYGEVNEEYEYLKNKFVYLGAFTITHYCDERYPHICGGSGVTASGAPTSVGKTVAVPTSRISLGTKLYIEGYGYRTAQDTGSAVTGNKIDMLVSTHSQALAMGTRYNVDVWEVRA